MNIKLGKSDGINVGFLYEGGRGFLKWCEVGGEIECGFIIVCEF